MSESLEEVRAELKELEEPLVAALAERARHPRGVTAGGPQGSLELVYHAGILPGLCPPGSATGVCAEMDTRLVGLLRRRLALGGRVADAKIRREPARFEALVRTGDRARILEALTDRDREDTVLARVREHALRLAGADMAERVVQVFARWIIPTTKEAEADRLLSPGSSP